jgi:uracil phosphoribosyltransferase
VASVHPSTHPLILSNVSALRDRRTPPAEFRRLVRVTAMLLAYEAMADLETREVAIETPLATALCRVPADKVAIVPVLRAGLGMADGVLDVVPEAEVWHIGLRRDEKTLRPEQYYTRLPTHCQVGLVLLLDPMLATGGSGVHACELLKASGVARLKFLAILAAPEGIARLSAAMPDVAIHVAAIDERLNDVGFIYPGLGDAGDRQFNTLPQD